MVTFKEIIFYFAFVSSILATSQHGNRHFKTQSPGLEKGISEHKIAIPFDHFHNESRYEPHTNETFENSYWLDTSNYDEGGPVFVLALGEDGSFDLPWLQKGLVHELANATGGIAVMWGQRYYAGNYAHPGVNESASLTICSFGAKYNTNNLRFMSTEQSLADLAYFAIHFIIGGSYGGVISAFTRIQYPDIFWGGLTSSEVTVPIIDFWQVYDVVRRYGPPACVEMQQKVTSIFDTIMLSHNKSAIAQLRTALDAKSLSNIDLASNLAIPWSNFVNSWVPGLVYNFSGPDTWCANLTSQRILYPALSNKAMIAAARDVIRNGDSGKEVDTLLHPVSSWFGNSRQFLPAVGGNQPYPFDWLNCIENPLFFTSYTPGTEGRPQALPVASRLLTVEQPLKHCRQVYNFSKTWRPDLNYYKRFGGFNLPYPRLAISTGQMDLWRGATPPAEYIAFDKPNPRVQSSGTTSEPQITIQVGSHEYDLPGMFPNQTTPELPPQAVKNAHQREVTVFKEWLAKWKKAHPPA